MRQDSQIYFDMDGVLSDLDTQHFKYFGCYPPRNRFGGYSAPFEKTDWQRIRESGDFFLTMPKMPDADDLVLRTLLLIKRRGMPMPIILTGINSDSVPEGPNHKRDWAKQHYPDLEVICTRSETKSTYCKVGDVLIDDWDKYKGLWEAKGGVFIVHTNSDESMKELEAVPYYAK